MEAEKLEVLIGEIDVSYRSTGKVSSRPILKSPKSIYEVFLQTWDADKIELVEQFKVMLLNRCHRILGICTLTTGNVSGTIADPKQVFSVALIANAVSVVIAHNHPSGCLTPSSMDETLTQKMHNAGQFLDIKVLDHLIITKEDYYSFAEAGFL